MRQQRCAAAPGRPGFTLVEMLVVLAILVVLASLSAGGIVRWIASQSQDTTETTMRGAYQVLNRQIKAAIDIADKEPDSKIPQSVRTMAGGDMRRARVIWKKLRLKQEFPTSYYEGWYPYAAANGVAILPANDLPAKAVYTRVLPKPATAPAATPTPPAPPAPNESSVCLLLALSQNRGGVRLSADDLPNTALSEISPGGPKLIIDAWAQPLVFYRWPTGNTELIGLNTTKFADPLDPEGLLLNPTWYASAGKGQFEALCHPISPDGQRAYYVIPTLASGGRDMTLGLDLTTMATTNANVVADNIYSYRLRLGLRGSTQ
jgi:prepilin-type N-terminal cleavage/methylation domain-containing protein